MTYFEKALAPYENDPKPVTPIGTLPEDAVLETGDRSYYFIKREAVCMGGQLLYYTGVMKRLQEGSYEVDNGSGDAGTGEAAG